MTLLKLPSFLFLKDFCIVEWGFYIVEHSDQQLFINFLGIPLCFTLYFFGFINFSREEFEVWFIFYVAQYYSVSIFLLYDFCLAKRCYFMAYLKLKVFFQVIWLYFFQQKIFCFDLKESLCYCWFISSWLNSYLEWTH